MASSALPLARRAGGSLRYTSQLLALLPELAAACGSALLGERRAVAGLRRCFSTDAPGEGPLPPQRAPAPPPAEAAPSELLSPSGHRWTHGAPGASSASHAHPGPGSGAGSSGWEHVPLPHDAQAPLRSAGLGPHVASRLARELGYARATDLALLPEGALGALAGPGPGVPQPASAPGAGQPDTGSGAAGGGAAGTGGGTAGLAGSAAVSAGLNAVELARLAAACREARRARVTPLSGSLQELAELLRSLRQAAVVDLGGMTWSGPIEGPDPTLRLALSNCALVNGTLLLAPGQALRLGGRGAGLADLSLRCLPAQPGGQQRGAEGAGAGGGGGGGASPPARPPPRARAQRVDRGLVVVEAGDAHVARCSIANDWPQVALLVSAGARAALHDCELSSGGAGVLAAGPGAEAELRGCTVRDTTGPCVAATGGARVSLRACSLLRSGASSGLAVAGGGSRAEAERVVVGGCAESCVAVGEGAEAELRDCSLSGSLTRQALQAWGRGARVALAGCELAGSAQSGAYVREGAEVEMQGCTLASNGLAGLVVAGAGSRALLAGTRILGNGTAGLHVCGGAAAEAEGCTAGAGDLRLTGPSPAPAPVSVLAPSSPRPQVAGPPSSQEGSSPGGEPGSEPGAEPEPVPLLVRAVGEGSRVALRGTAVAGGVEAEAGAMVETE
ncbi:hypothetical protein HYH03_015133 [Edaphochlamys debaryana]|uniref:Right handed beta helix domain-containing protein n=1 Tax=Edaphochlamys debaryana TaxID=47281 RepID=A0A835XUJ9_9CHLO|nr:hypothetical protein HYH03_015133 [Edaphochlamys debaryana]|eukprot:KAG2486169.1 hypothetical protein HYH03_015133 [Edaphochlamys debaryana]